MNHDISNKLLLLILEIEWPRFTWGPNLSRFNTSLQENPDTFLLSSYSYSVSNSEIQECQLLTLCFHCFSVVSLFSTGIGGDYFNDYPTRAFSTVVWYVELEYVFLFFLSCHLTRPTRGSKLAFLHYKSFLKKCFKWLEIWHRFGP